MLQSRTLTSVFRQHPLQAYVAQVPRRIATRPSTLLHQTSPIRRYLSSNSLIPKRIVSPPSWRTPSHLRFRNLRRSSNKPSPSATQEGGSQEAQSLSARFKQLSRKYGYSAVGVYFGLSILDFPFCFLAVRLVGPERVGEVEHAIVDSFWSLVGLIMPSMRPETRAPTGVVEAAAREGHPANGNGHKVKDNASMYTKPGLARDLRTDNVSPGIWTQLLLAYGVHKSLIFFRIPLTAAVTPKVVKTLRSWGWNIGNRQARTVR